jgi:hypothetical protein
MDRPLRNAIANATQDLRRVLEDDYRTQLDGVFDIRATGDVAHSPGAHLSDEQRVTRSKLVGILGYHQAGGLTAAEALQRLVRDAAFTTLNRFIALRMLEARELVQACVSKGQESGGYREFVGLAPGLDRLPGRQGYRVYLECLFDELSTEIKVLFDRSDAASLLWPEHKAFTMLIDVLGRSELRDVWDDDETIGWFYQFFNSKEERQQMRDESQAPRNSRELAVRNQFFTPRYVVQFLVDNTLGRMWTEMAGTTVALSEHCEYFVEFEDERPTRPFNDPRDIRVLDPACGSGHFLLYAFDLLTQMYLETWEQGLATEGRRSLRETYESRADLERVLPRLILERNLYGIEIDPRAAQIAALALWLRAQRFWRDAALQAAERPRVRRTGIIVAEPMPGDTQLIDEFAARLAPPLLGSLFRQIVHAMSLAGDMGCLLRAESELAGAIAEARAEFVRRDVQPQALPGFGREAEQGELDLSGIDDDGFFVEAESRLLDALVRYATESAGATGTRRRLFAEDSTYGVALLELLRQRFDVVLMNPPFGAGSLRSKRIFDQSYPRSKNDVYAAFVERGIELLKPRGLLGAITSRTGFFLSTFQKWREDIILQTAPPLVFADLGQGVLDGALVEVAAYCLSKGDGIIPGERSTESEQSTRAPRATFLRLVEVDNKSSALQATGRPLLDSYYVPLESLRRLPGSAFGYWLPSSITALFNSVRTIGSVAETRIGMGTLDDFRFLRTWWESPQHAGLVPFVKAANAGPWYSDLQMLVRWGTEGNELKAFVAKRVGSASRKIQSEEYYLRPGLSWSRRPHRRGWFRLIARGAIVADNGPMAYGPLDWISKAVVLLNSSLVYYLMNGLMSRGQSGAGQTLIYEAGSVDRLPLPAEEPPESMVKSAHLGWSLRRSLDTVNEVSHSFVVPAVLQVDGGSFVARSKAWSTRLAAVEAELAGLQVEIDALCFDLYGISEEDRRVITEGSGVVDNDHMSGASEDEEDEEDGADVGSGDLRGLAAQLVSWAVGVTVGRFDVRLATGERAWSPEPDPFDPLPASSPGMLTGEDGLPIDAPPPGYPVSTSPVLVFDPGHPLDITARVRSVFDVVFGDEADVWWAEVGEALGAREGEVRAWLAKGLFDHHLKLHSKSRRKAPVLWPIGTASGSYLIWLYGHRVTSDSLFQVVHDIVGPTIALADERLTQLRQTAGPLPSASQRHDIDKQSLFIDELRELAQRIEAVAPLCTPDLSDGVVIVLAPLWQLFAHYPAWSRELKGHWAKLAAGSYDWSHIAMHLWPERVIRKCSEDLSLAIAHNLEDVFWAHDGDNPDKSHPRDTPTTSIEQLVTNHHNPAITAALGRLK